MEAVSIVKYTKVLEGYHRLSEECRDLEERLQSEFNFAEEKVKEIELLNRFINSHDNVKKLYDEFMNNPTKEE